MQIEKSALFNDLPKPTAFIDMEDSPQMRRMSILFGNKGICRYERFARVKKQKLLFTKIRAELKVFNSVEAEINRRSERDSQIRQEMGIVAETD